MTLFTLLIVMALERVVDKSKSMHITKICRDYFSVVLPLFIKKHEKADSKDKQSYIFIILLVALLPSLLAWFVLENVPGLFVLLFNIAGVWICLGCPVTRKTYKSYLQAANREDFEACSLYSERLGVESKDEGNELSNVGKQLVLINYRQYAAVIIFFIALGLPGVIFYSICKEYLSLQKSALVTTEEGDEASSSQEEQSEPKEPFALNASQSIMLYLDWIPARITAFGFLLVGHFSKGLPVWLDVVSQLKITAYSLLAKVAKASEEIDTKENPNLHEALQMVKLVKRNIVFLLISVSIMTLLGFLG